MAHQITNCEVGLENIASDEQHAKNSANIPPSVCNGNVAYNTDKSAIIRKAISFTLE